MAPGKGLLAYRIPLNGNETHKSGFEVTQQRIFERKEAEFQSRLKNMKPSIDFSPPKSSLMKHMISNLKRRETDFQRFSEIERENCRLLDKMSKIMERSASQSIMGAQDTQSSLPALNAVRSRERRTKQVDEQNQTILKRICNTKPYYSAAEWDVHAHKTQEFIGNMSRYPNQVFLLKESDVRKEATIDSSNDSRRIHGAVDQVAAARRRRLGGSVSAPPVSSCCASVPPGLPAKHAGADEPVAPGFQRSRPPLHKMPASRPQVTPAATKNVPSPPAAKLPEDQAENPYEEEGFEDSTESPE